MTNSLGNVFSDEIDTGRTHYFSRVHAKQNTPTTKGRVLFFILIFIFGIGILSARLFFVTIIDGARYRKLAQGNRIREVPIYAPRGILYAADGSALVRNIPMFTTQKGEVYFERPASPGGELKERVTREYVYHDIFAHTIGYTGEVTGEELLKLKLQPQSGQYNYKMSDVVGKMGLEQMYDTTLRGRDGKELYEVDALGERIRTLGRVEPIPGENMNLTFDVGLQQIAHAEMAGIKGAIVATNPHTGEVLALYSSPSFDPNDFIRGHDLEPVFTSPDQPLFDRAIGGLYPPGSTFKIITAIAGLETGVITPSTQIEDTGILKVGPYSFGNWYYLQYGKTDGAVNIMTALKRSNDIYFYKAGEAIGIQRMAEWARKLGVSRKLGIDLPGEAEGLMPDPDWTKRIKNEQWYLGNTYHVSIGQGDILTTPLQVNTWTNVIANGGNLCTPHLVKDPKDIHCTGIRLKKETLRVIKQGMEEACETGGTAWPLFNFKIKNEKIKIDNVDFLESTDASSSAQGWRHVKVACKTGTAEFGHPKNDTHAWFTIFAPANNPTISITVLKEGAGEGSSQAAPVAKKMLEEWFKR